MEAPIEFWEALVHLLKIAPILFAALLCTDLVVAVLVSTKRDE